MSDPSTWTARQRAAVAGSLLHDLLRTVPTERTVWTDPDSVSDREAAAQEISAQMDQVTATKTGAD